MNRKLFITYVLILILLVKVCVVYAFENPIEFEENGLWGIKNRDGEILIEAKYNEIAGFVNGYSVVETDNGFGLIDYLGNEIVPCIYDDVSTPEDGYFVVVWFSDDDEQVCYDFYSCDGSFTGWRFENASGFSYGYACVIEDGKEYLMNTEGELISISPYQIGFGGGFNNGRLMVYKDGLYGYMDQNLHLIIPCQYEYAFPFYNYDETIVRIDGKEIRIDRNGIELANNP